MASNKADLLLHPVRLRIVMALANSKPQTAQQIGQQLKDVAPATLYRQLGRLVEGGVLQVVEERQARGAVEKVYALDTINSNLGPKEMRAASPADHMRYFTTFVASLLNSFEQYIEQPGASPVDDGVGYRHMPLYLSHDEMIELAQRMGAALLPFLTNQSGEDRKRYLLSFISMPAAEQKE